MNADPSRESQGPTSEPVDEGIDVAAALRATTRGVRAVADTVLSVQQEAHRRVKGTAQIVERVTPGAKPATRGTAAVVSAVDAGSRAVNTAIKGVSRGVDGAAHVADRAGARAGSGPAAAATRAAVAGAFGDHLAQDPATEALAPPMTIRVDGRAIAPDQDSLLAAFPQPTGTIVVFVHGLSTTELLWGPDFARQAGESGATAVFVRYTTGRPVADNGHDLAVLIRELVEHWPVEVDRLVLVAHSMGGLVARAALADAESESESASESVRGSEAGPPWLDLTTDIITLGTPHRGAPLEKVAHAVISAIRIDPLARPIADLLNSRSRGIKDLRFGAVTEDDWQGRHPDDPSLWMGPVQPLPAGVRHHAVAATLGGPAAAKSLVLGDGLVREPSAAQVLGDDHASLETLAEVGHVELLSDPRAVAVLARVLADEN